MSTTFEEGTWVWLPSDEHIVVPAKVKGTFVSGSEGKVSTEDGEVRKLARYWFSRLFDRVYYFWRIYCLLRVHCCHKLGRVRVWNPWRGFFDRFCAQPFPDCILKDLP